MFIPRVRPGVRVYMRIKKKSDGLSPSPFWYAVAYAVTV